MLNKLVVVLLTLTVAASSEVLAAGDPAAGKAKSSTCIACHGAGGVSSTDLLPNLSGQKQAYMIKQLKAFREGSRVDPLMSPMAKPLSDQDIEDLTAYFSTQSAAPVSVAADADAGPQTPIAPSSIIKLRAHPTRKYWQDKLPEGPGRDTIIEKCQTCHDLQRTIATARPKERWQGVVDAMHHRGAPVSAEDVTQIVHYLEQHFSYDSPPISEPGGVHEVAIKPCKPSDWPKGSKDFRSTWVAPYNVWVSNQQGGNIDIVDPVKKDIVRRIGCVSAPDRVEFGRDGDIAYVPDRSEQNVTVIDTHSGAIKAKVPLIGRPNTSVLSRDFKKLYVGIWPLNGDEYRRGYVQVMDTEKLKIIETIETNGGIHDPWMSPDGKLLLAMSPEGRFQDLYDTRDDHKLWTCCTEAEIGTMNMEAAGSNGSTSRIFFSYSGYPGVVVIDPKDGRELERVDLYVDKDGPSKGIRHAPPTSKALGFHGGEISKDGKSLWVTAGSYVYKYDLPSVTAVGDVHLALVDLAGNRYSPPVEGSWLTMSPGGDKVFAARSGRNMVSIIDAETMKEEVIIPVGEYPLHISVWPRGTP